MRAQGVREAPVTKKRIPLLRKFTIMETLVVALLSRGEAYRMIALRLNISVATVRFHLANAARKIPGDLEVRMKVIFWCRGAKLDQLTGLGWEPKYRIEAQRPASGVY